MAGGFIQRAKLAFLVCFGFCCSSFIAASSEIKCGLRNIELIKKQSKSYALSIEASPSDFGEYPWTIDISKNDQSYCVGSLIHPKVVLTSRSCAISLNSNDFMVSAGVWDREGDNWHFLAQSRGIDKIIADPFLIPGGQEVSLLFLKEPFVLAAHINTVCLPPADYVIGESRFCYGSGWGGYKVYSSGNRIMKRILMVTVDSETCKNQMFRNIKNSIFCAAGLSGNDTTCLRDLGGPLVSRISLQPQTPDQYHQIGIMLFGKDLCFSETPGAYIDVAKSRVWIDMQMKENGLDSTTYTA
uniref:Peptidase S1 domain-containing protein n=1 Tax=Stomoxys calcitrans TaxID=35570 RepID=A0A1I8P3E3_STOCA